ncbi:MAG TPA: hypothetical protein VFZ17_11165 [Acidimicrobiia bacterium]|nr:hypothetical protein [Acidimicrobiia bacterium]
MLLFTVALLALAMVPVGAGAATSVKAAKSAASGTCPDPSGTIKLGVSYFGGVANNVTDLGGEEEAAALPADQATIDGYKAGAKAISAAGGIAGCQVEVVPFNFSAAAKDFNQMSQQECAAFTQDNKVFAVYAVAYETKVALDCFAKAKTPFVTAGGNYPPTCADYKKYAGYVYSPSGVATCRFSSFIKTWDKAGLFPKDAKVGILAMDDGSGQGKALADDIWIPELKKMKIPAQSFSYTGSINEATFADVNAALGNAILQFKAAGVNTVLMTPAGAQAVVAFMPQAKAQGFFPNYGLTTADSISLAGSIGGDAIKKGVAISWTIQDLPLTEQQALPANPAIEACAEWSTASTTTLTGSSGYCDFLNFLQTSMKSATKVDAATLKKGVDALGTSFVSSVTYGGATKFSKSQYSGASKALILDFDPTSKTWAPKSDTPVAIP